jgi:universal stress protein A
MMQMNYSGCRNLRIGPIGSGAWRAAEARSEVRKKEVAMKSIQRILFATDFSSASEAALERAIDLAKDNGAELLVTHVYEPPSRLSLDGYVLPQVYDDFESALREEAESRLSPLVSKAGRAGVKARSLLVKGIPFRAIARAAKTNDADLVVMGTHGRTGVARLFLGSVAARVISTAPCPVLTVRAA